MEVKMRKLCVHLINVFVGATIAFALFSCAHESSGRGDMAISPEQHQKILGEYQKGVEESKRIVIARVNGVEITLQNLLDRMNQIAPNFIPRGHQRTPEIDLRVKQEALDVLIFRELAVQEAVRRGLQVPPGKIDGTLNKIKERLGSEDAFNKSLSMTGETEESLRKGIEKNMLFEMIAKQEIFRKAQEDPDPHSVENRKQEWEAELKKDAKIEVFLDQVEKEMREDIEQKGNSEKVKE